MAQAETPAAENPGMEELYQHYKSYAFSIAYRMLGVVADAEDAVQDLFAELQHRDRSGIQNIKAYLAKGMTNRCLNMLNSARSRRDLYRGVAAGAGKRGIRWAGSGGRT